MTFIVRSDEDLIDLIKRFGKDFIKDMCFYKKIKYEYDKTPSMFLDDNILKNTKVNQLPKNKAILMKMYDKFYKAYVIRCNKKFTCRSEKDLIDLIKRFGKEFVLKMCYHNNIKYEIDLSDEFLSDEFLLKIGFKKEILNDIRRRIKHRKTYIGKFIYHFVRTLKVEQLPENKAILMKLYNRWWKTYVIRYRKKFEGIDLETDPITFEPIVFPVYIQPDWDNNCKIVYSLKTVLNFCKKQSYAIGFVQDEAGVDNIIYKDIYLDYFLSPYTRYKFYTKDIKIVYMDLLEN